MAINDGGPAFPHVSSWMQEFGDEGKCIGCWPSGGGGGMSLRDWLAAKAMPIVMSEWDFSEHWTQAEELRINTRRYQYQAQRAYLIADAMLAARDAKADSIRAGGGQ